MKLQEFRATLENSAPPPELPLFLTALWWDAKGDWQRAHECAQQGETREHAWVHAYLHRKEGDAANAHYWYRQAGRPIASGALNDEWTRIVQALLANQKS